MQKTLVLLKPDCLENKVAGQVIGRFEENGYEIKASKMLQLDDALLREHYAHVKDLPFFPEIASYAVKNPLTPYSAPPLPINTLPSKTLGAPVIV